MTSTSQIISGVRSFLDTIENTPGIDAAELRRRGEAFGPLGGTLFELEASRRDTSSDESTLTACGERTFALFEAAQSDPVLVHVACDAAAILLRLLAEFGVALDAIAQECEEALDDLAEVGPAHGAAVKAARFTLLEGLYDARTLSLDHEVLVDERERRHAIATILQFIAIRLDPAAHERIATLVGRDDSGARNETTRIKLSQTHRRLSWEASLAAEQLGEKSDHPAQWMKLSREYEDNGDRRNAAAALANGIERYLEAWQRSGKEVLLSTISELTVRLEKVMDDDPNAASEDIRKIAARAYLALGATHDAERHVRAATSAKKALLTGADRFRTSLVLRDADDWLGIAAAADLHCAIELRQSMRPSSIPLDAAEESPPGTHVLFPILGRQHACIAVLSGETPRLLSIASAHDLARTLDALHRHARKDITDYAAGTPTETKWRDLLQRLAGMLRLHELGELCAGGRIILLLEGSAVHVPWPGVFIASNVKPTSIELRLLHKMSATERAKVAPAAVTWSAFRRNPTPEQWSVALEEISRQLGAEFRDVADTATPSFHELLLLGAHGHRSTFGELSLRVGDRSVPAREVVEMLPIGATSFCGVCYAAGGFLSGDGLWESLPAMLLARGAQRVLANVWPAWDHASRRGSLARTLDTIKTAADVHGASEVVTKWLLAEASEHPRWWSGWGLWTAPPPPGS